MRRLAETLKALTDIEADRVVAGEIVLGQQDS